MIYAMIYLHFGFQTLFFTSLQNSDLNGRTVLMLALLQQEQMLVENLN
jgi:hypothetical protein